MDLEYFSAEITELRFNVYNRSHLNLPVLASYHDFRDLKDRVGERDCYKLHSTQSVVSHMETR